MPALLLACDDNDDDLSPDQAQARAAVAAKDNSGILGVTQEVLDLTSMALLEKGVSGGRETTGSRMKAPCFPTISASYEVKKSADSVVYSGTLTVDFGDGSSCEDSTAMRRGKITDEFRYVIAYQDTVPFSAMETITFDGFQRDSVKVDGAFVSTYTSDGSHSIDVDDAMLTYPDETTVRWSGLLAYRYHDGGTNFNPVDDTKSLSGSISGTTRENVNFTASITEDVLFANQCGGKHEVPVSGIVEIAASGTNAEVDYGDGTCDTSYTITVNGETTAYDFEPKNI
jgi:hypothetical protein